MLPRPRLCATRTIIETTPEADTRAAEAFARDNAIAFEDAFGDDVRAILDRTCANTTFVPEGGVSGPRLREVPPRPTGLVLRSVINRPVLRDWLSKITGRGPLDDVRGSTARFEAGTEQQLDWHNDVNDDPRALGFTVGLGHEDYEGGVFEIKPSKSADVTFRFHHVKPFALVVFPIGKAIMHRVTPVTAGGPRTVYGGWFWGPNGVTAGTSSWST